MTSVFTSYELSRMFATNGKYYSDRDFVKQCLVRRPKLGTQRKHNYWQIFHFQEPCFWADRSITELFETTCESRMIRIRNFSITITDTVGIIGIVKLEVSMRPFDSIFITYEELIEVIPMHGAITSQYNWVKQVLHEHGFDLRKLVCISIVGAANMVGSYHGVAAKLPQK